MFPLSKPSCAANRNGSNCLWDKLEAALSVISVVVYVSWHQRLHKADPVLPSERSNPELWTIEGLAEHGNRNTANRCGKDIAVRLH